MSKEPIVVKEKVMCMDTDVLFTTIENALQEEGADYIAVFGSYAREESHAGSDIDILVQFRDTKSLMDIVRIERDLSERLGMQVDLVTENALSPYIRDKVKDEAQVLMR